MMSADFVVRSSVLQCVAVRCSDAMCCRCCSGLQWVALRCGVLQCVAVCCSVLQCVAARLEARVRSSCATVC